MSEPTPAIEGRAIDKSFGDTPVLRSVSLSVMPGEVVCVVGPSGSGKSTLLRCLNWLSPPTAGEVFIAGEPLGKRRNADGTFAPLGERALRRQRSRIGMVFQQFNLWPHRTALENVIEGPMIVRGLSRRDAIERAEPLMEMVGLADKRDAYPVRLSGGQQQRVAIARALAMEPEILLFDEPTSALDPELVGEVLSVMKDLAARHTTMIVVTHEIGFAAEAADRMVFMDEGRIVEEGPPRTILHTPKEERSRRFLEKFMSRSSAMLAADPETPR
ncbi:MAG: amino acid ABC transporter ATP-binding protein [Azospirillaceae bacterium]